MLSRLQRTKRYFFAICVLLSIIVCIFSWQLFRQSPYQSVRELDRIGMTEQFSKIEAMNKPLASLEKYLRRIHNKTEGIVAAIKNLSSSSAHSNKGWNDPVPSSGRGNGAATANTRKNRHKDALLKANKSQVLIENLQNLSKQKKLLNSHYNNNNNNNNNKNNNNKNNNMKKNSSYSIINIRTRIQNFNKKNNNNNNKVNTQKKTIKSENIPLASTTKGKHKTNNVKQNSISNNNQKNSAELKKVKLDLNPIKLKIGGQPIQSRIPDVFVDDIHNFHTPERKKFLNNRDNLEDALSRAALDPQDHILTGKLCLNCQSLGFQYDLNVEDVCNGEVRLLIVVESPPNNRMARDAIRKTWGIVNQSSTSEVRVVFLLGKSNLVLENALAINEHWQNQDIVQIDFMDAYANLTYKTLSGLHWVNTFCSNAKYVMKTDDDMYVNTPLIAKMLLASPKTRFLGGYCWGMSTPHRDNRSKWYVPYEMYPGSTFPPMCSGTGYIMSRDLVTSIINVSMGIGFFYLEDVYIALCLEKFDIYPVNIQGFSNMLISFDSCHFRNSVLTSHGHTPYELRDEWPQIQTCPQKDLTPHQLFMPIPYPEVD